MVNKITETRRLLSLVTDNMKLLTLRRQLTPDAMTAEDYVRAQKILKEAAKQVASEAFEVSQQDIAETMPPREGYWIS